MIETVINCLLIENPDTHVSLTLSLIRISPQTLDRGLFVQRSDWYTGISHPDWQSWTLEGRNNIGMKGLTINYSYSTEGYNCWDTKVQLCNKTSQYILFIINESKINLNVVDRHFSKSASSKITAAFFPPSWRRQFK